MSRTRVAGKSPMEMLKQEDLAGDRLFAEYSKLEEIDPSENDRFFEQNNEALTIGAEIEEGMIYPSVRDAWSGEAEDVFNEGPEDHPIVKTLLDEMSGLEAEYEHFEATTKVLHENFDHHCGEE